VRDRDHDHDHDRDHDHDLDRDLDLDLEPTRGGLAPACGWHCGRSLGALTSESLKGGRSCVRPPLGRGPNT
jgi:hypothetical protein